MWRHRVENRTRTEYQSRVMCDFSLGSFNDSWESVRPPGFDSLFWYKFPSLTFEYPVRVHPVRSLFSRRPILTRHPLSVPMTAYLWVEVPLPRMD